MNYENIIGYSLLGGAGLLLYNQFANGEGDGNTRRIMGGGGSGGFFSGFGTGEPTNPNSQALSLPSLTINESPLAPAPSPTPTKTTSSTPTSSKKTSSGATGYYSSSGDLVGVTDSPLAVNPQSRRPTGAEKITKTPNTFGDIPTKKITVQKPKLSFWKAVGKAVTVNTSWSRFFR